MVYALTDPPGNRELRQGVRGSRGQGGCPFASLRWMVPAARPLWRVTALLVAAWAAAAGCGQGAGPERASVGSRAGEQPTPVGHVPEASPTASAPVLALPPRVDQCAAAGARASAEVSRRQGVVYRRFGTQDLALDIYHGEAGAAATLVLVHGGGWRAGERNHLHEEAVRLAQRGFTAVTVDYRLLPVPFPAAASDVRCAIRFLASESSLEVVDPQRIVPVGFSSGGHLVALAALAPEDLRLDDVPCPYPPASVAAWVAYFSPFDLQAEAPLPAASRRLVGRFLGGAPSVARERAQRASPILHVTEHAPPALLIHGTADPVVPYLQSEAMMVALEARDVPVRLVDLPGASHGFRMFSAAALHRPGLCTLLAFLERLGGR